MAGDPEAKGLRRLRRIRTRGNATNLHREQAKSESAKTAYTPAYYRQLYKRIAGWALVSLGLLVAGSHVITHLGYFQVLPNVGLQDLLMGYPMAGILFVGGIMLFSN